MEKELLDKLKQHDQEAVAAFIDAYRDRIYTTAYRLTTNKDDALDITQDVFVRILENVKRLERSQSINSYINSITFNRSYDYLRARGKKRKYFDMIPLFTHKEPVPLENLKRKELKQIVLEAVGRLSKGERQVILLKYYHDFKIREIAQSLSKSEGTIKKQLHRAKGKLEKILRKELK